jgi:hypothetical protein
MYFFSSTTNYYLHPKKNVILDLDEAKFDLSLTRFIENSINI